MTLVPDRIRWYDDMLVTARHVDAVASRLEALVQELPARLQPYAWGVVRADVSLREELVEVRDLEAVMPNGLPVALATGGPRFVLDLRPFMSTARARRFLVHLATPLEEDQRAGEAPRFVLDAAESGIVGDDAVPAERKRQRLVLFAGDAPPTSRYASFPLIEISTEGSAPAITDFVPPLLRAGPPWPLVERCAAVPERLRREMAAVAAGVPDDQPPYPAEIRARLAPLITVLPPYEVLAASHPHPFVLYVELCRVAAATAAMRNRVVPPAFPPYQHEDARASFDPVLRFVLGDADVRPAPAFHGFRFEREGLWFRLPPDPGWTGALAPGSSLQAILALEGVASESQAEHWGTQCVIASRSAMQSQLSRRVLGLARRRIAPPGSLPVERDVYLFRLEPDPELVRPEDDLLVLSDVPGITPATLTLYVVDPERTQLDGPTP